MDKHHSTNDESEHPTHEPPAATIDTQRPFDAFASTSSDVPPPSHPGTTPDTNSSNPQPSARPTNAGLVVLQWLTYAFWGWTVFGLSALTWAIIASFIEDADVSGFMPYGIAAVLVLLPISFLCDYFYSKQEPTRKTGPETIVMVVHAVLFALFGIGSLIFGVFAAVQLLTDPTDNDYALTALFSSGIIAGYYGLTFLRTLNSSVWSRFTQYYKYFMLGTVSLIVLLGFIGPVAKELSLRNDKLIRAELPNVHDAIKRYADENNKLPTDLQAVELSKDTKKLVDRDLVTYKPNTKEPTASANGSIDYENIEEDEGNTSLSDLIKPLTDARANLSIEKVYYYQLCVDYKKETRDYEASKNRLYAPETDDGYSSYLDTYDHPAGETCYKLKTAETYQ